MKTLEFSVGKTEKILLDANQDAVVSVGGGSAVSGIIKCPENTIELTVTGGSTIEIYGECRHLIIRKASGACFLNLSSFFCEEATIELADWGTSMELAVSRVIHSVCLRKGSILLLSGTPQILNISLTGGSVIEQKDNE